MASNIIKRENDFIKGAFKTTIVTVALYVGINACSKLGAADFVLRKLDNRFSDKKIEMMQEVEEETGIDAENNINIYILHAVLKNDKLEDWEKEIIYGFENIIKDNPYINLSRSYNSLEKLDIVYTERTSEYKDTVYGVYIPDLNEIHMFQDKDNVNLDILKHELVHGLFKYNSSSLPAYFTEGTTEILVNEYLSENPFIEKQTYPFEVAMVKLLANMVGSDKVLEAYTKGSKNIIMLELAETMGVVNSIEFLNDIEELFVSFESGKEVDSELFYKIMKTSNAYLTNKYAASNDQQVAEKFFYLQGLLENMLLASPYENYWEYLKTNGIFTEAYFSKKLKEEVPVRRINTDNSEFIGEQKVYKYVS